MGLSPSEPGKDTKGRRHVLGTHEYPRYQLMVADWHCVNGPTSIFMSDLDCAWARPSTAREVSRAEAPIIVLTVDQFLY